jgi:signal transduction histidine kinase
MSPMRLSAPVRSSRAMQDDRLDLLATTVAGAATGEAASVAEAVREARETVAPLLAGPRPELAEGHFVSALLVRLAVETDSDLSALAPVMTVLEHDFAVDRFDLALHVLGDPLLLDLPLDAAVEAVTGMLRLLAPAEKVSLWLHEPGRGPDRLQPGWDAEPETEAALTRRELMLEAAAQDEGLCVAKVSCWHRPCAAIVVVPEAEREAECRALADRAAAILGPAFERASLIEGNISRSEALVSTAEKRLTRLGFDLHDGPLQDVAVLAGNLDGIRRHLADTLGGTPLGQRLLAELEDAAAVAEFLGCELRDLATSLDGSGISRCRFDDVLAGVVRKFISRSDVEIELELLGETDNLTQSQKITLLRVVQEALANVREHSGARNVRVSVDARGSHVEAMIGDDGHGFIVEDGMLRAGRDGRMGLAGMVERVRLLGGVCDIVSAPGHGTSVSLTIARWVPEPAAAEPEAPAAISRVA